ncbi:MAG: NAD(P)-dependent alcohol dehydrogenase [Bdellovibrionaceae bacterium]|nr:NAD(P)-dependent alcohol dehydrogenase [Pseudobdellovibrionaceae bacterium]
MSKIQRISYHEKFGSAEVLSFKDQDIPSLPPDSFLVRGHFASVSVGDVRIRAKNVPRGFKMFVNLVFGFKRPRYPSLGTDYVGDVVKCNGDTSVKVGDRIAADLGMTLGGHASHRIFKSKETYIVLPNTVSSEAVCASIFGGVTALHFLRNKLQLKQGEKILIIGAGGAVGSSAVQLAKFWGAHVTAVCSREKSKSVYELGADQVIDYKSSNWKDQLQKYDVVLDTVGELQWAEIIKILAPAGRVGFVVADLLLKLRCALLSLFTKRKYFAGAVNGTRADLAFLMDLMEKKKLKPLIGEIFSFDNIKEAHQSVESGHKLGTTLIKF